MAILTIDDLDIYLPSLSDGNIAEIESAMATAQFWAESYLGANRPLELTEFVEIKTLNNARQTTQLSYLPIVSSPEPIIKYRHGGNSTSLKEEVLISDWVTADSKDYVIDRNGRLHLTTNGINQWGRYTGNPTQIEATYTSGFDFADTDNPNAVAIKRSLASIVAFTQSQQAKGIQSYEEVGAYRVTFQSTSSASNSSSKAAGVSGTIPEIYLFPFKKYAPRHWR